MSDIYVILIDGKPYRKNSAIRTYKTRNNAEVASKRIGRYWVYRGSTLEVGRFAAEEAETVSVDRPDYSAPWPYTVPKEEAVE